MKANKVFATILATILALVATYTIIPYVDALLWALVLFVILRNPRAWIERAGVSRKHASKLCIIILLVLLILPLTTIITILSTQASELYYGLDNLQPSVSILEQYFPNLDLDIYFDQGLLMLSGYIQNMAYGVLTGIGSFILHLTIMVFVLYYLLIAESQKMDTWANLIPFNAKNRKRLIQEFVSVTEGTIVVSGLIALMQGTIVSLVFWWLGVPSAIIWGLITAFLAFLPVVGASLVWMPAIIYYVLQNNVIATLVLLFTAAVLTIIDNIWRPMLTHKFGNIHPVAVIIGAFSGIPVFGIIGIIIGPLLITYLQLIFNMIKEEYLM